MELEINPSHSGERHMHYHCATNTCIVAFSSCAWHQWRTLGGVRGVIDPPIISAEAFILKNGSTMTTMNNQHNRTKWHCLKTNKKQYSKFLIFCRSMPPHPSKRLLPLALTSPIFPEVSTTAWHNC